METPCRTITLALLLLLTAATGTWAVVVPEDAPTIEALIDAHKHMKKAEDMALAQLTTIREEHSLTERATTAWNTTRSVLNKKMSDAQSYLKLAMMIASTTLQIKNMTEEYADFTSTTYRIAQKKPYVMVFYLRAHAHIAQEMKSIRNLAANVASSNMNVLKASIEDKYRMLGLLSASVGSVRRIMDRNALFIRSIGRSGLQIWHMEELLGIMSSKGLGQMAVERWLQANGY